MQHLPIEVERKLQTAKNITDDLWFDYTRMPKIYQDEHPLSYWQIFIRCLNDLGYEVTLENRAVSKKRSESMADVS